MSKQVHQRVLTGKDRYRPGDLTLDVESHRWIPVRKEFIGDYHEPQSVSPTIRSFYMPEGQSPNDVEAQEIDKKGFDFRKSERCTIIFDVAGSLHEVVFDPTFLSASKNYVKVMLMGNDQWILTDNLDAGAREVL